MFHRKEEDLVKDVVNLRNQLRITDISLQSLEEQLSGSNSSPSEHSPERDQPGGLTLEDLQRPDVTQPPRSSPIFRETSVRMAEPKAGGSVPLTDPRPSSSWETEMENHKLRRTLGSLQEENSCLLLENQKLANDLETAQLELAGSKTKILLLGTTIGSKSSSVVVMKEQILGLETEVEAQAIALRDAEERLEESQQSVVMTSRLVNKLKDELKSVKAELAHRSSKGKRAEQQRNEALRNAEKLTVAFKEYKGNVSAKLKKVLENEVKLKESLIECDREREELESKCSKLEQERAEMSQLIQQLKENSSKMQAVSAENAAMKRENKDLRTHSASQEQKLARCLREAEESRAELSSLEAILSLLHLREGGGGALCAKPCALPSVSLPVDSTARDSKPGEMYRQLLPALQALEQERSRQGSVVSNLQERLSRAQEEISTLQCSMAQRASHFQHIHNELMEKANEATRLEREMKKKNTRLAALEKQLQEKTTAYTAAAVKNCELEQSLLEKTYSIQHLESLLSKKQKDFQQALEKSKKARFEQCKQLQDQMELLQLSLEQKQAQVLQLEQGMSVTQQEKQDAQRRADQLQASLAQVTQEKELKIVQTVKALRHFEEQALESATKVKNLETALSSCRNELNTCVQQMEEAKVQFEKQLEEKADDLEMEMRNSAQAAKASSKHIMQLQVSLQQRQTMLQESSARVSELEDSQAQLQKEVSKLEQQLEMERAGAAQELNKREQELKQEVQMKEQETADLSESLTQLKAEMSKTQEELMMMESELHQLRRDSSAKASQLNQMEETLQETQGLLEKKSEMVMDLEEKLHRSEMDRRNSLKLAQHLESQLNTVRGELANTRDHLQELQVVLQRTELTSEERRVALEKQAEELSECKRELEERNHEVLDLDTELKERQEELLKRAEQVSEMEVAVGAYKNDMQENVLHLEKALEKSGQELQKRTERVEILSEQLKIAKEQLQQKENVEKESREQGQQLRLCREKLQQTTQELQEARSRCDSANQLAQEKEAEVKQLTAMEAEAALREADLQVTVASLQNELDRLKQEHSIEVLALKQSRPQLLKIAETRADQLAEQLKQSSAQLEEVQGSVASLQEQIQNANDNLIIKESEITRLRAEISSYERRAEIQSVSQPQESVPQTEAEPPSLKERPEPSDSSNPADNDSLDLQQSARESPEPSYDWQDQSQLEATSSDLSFNPLTYMASDDPMQESYGQQASEFDFKDALSFFSAKYDAKTPPQRWTSDSDTESSLQEQQADQKEDDHYSPGDI